MKSLKNHLVIGMGEVGQGVFDVLRGHYSVFARDKDPVVITQHVEFLHIAIPHSEEFDKQVQDYIKLYKPELTIVYSTVPIGTCEKLQVVHSPVEGKHPTIGLSIQNSARWIGTSDTKRMKKAKKIWEQIVPVRELPKADFTEALKLISTTEYGINIEFARYKKMIADSLGMDYIAMKQWNLDYNNLYQRLGHLEYQKYILDPPEGPKGGHCVTPNARILDKQYPSELTKIVGEL